METHFRLKFFSNREQWRDLMPDTTFAVPFLSTTETLNVLVNDAIKESAEEWTNVNFDFMLKKVLLRTSLAQYLDEQSIPVERLILAECVPREPEPQPQYDIQLDSLVMAVRANTHITAAGVLSGEVFLYSPTTGDGMNKTLIHDGAVRCLELIPSERLENGCRMASSGADQVIVLSDVEDTGRHVTQTHFLKGHERSVEFVIANPLGTRLVSGSVDKKLKVWNIELDDETTEFRMKNQKAKKRKKMEEPEPITKTPMVTLTDHIGVLVGATWMPNTKGDVVTVSWHQRMVLWDLEMAGMKDIIRSNKAFLCVHSNPFNSMIIAGSEDSVIRLYDLRSREGSTVKQAFAGHLGCVSAVRWSPHKSHLFVSSSYDKINLMWDVRSSNTPLYEMKGHSDRTLSNDWTENDVIVSGGLDCAVITFQAGDAH